jgi:hypothetical protein
MNEPINMKIKKFKYECEKCNYKCNKRFLWIQHCKTKKHNALNMKHNEHNETHKTCARECPLCNKSFNSRTTLWRHKKTCKGIQSEQICHDAENELDLIKSQNEDYLKLLLKMVENQSNNINKYNIENVLDKVAEMLQNMQEMQQNMQQNMQKEFLNALQEIAKEPKIVNNTQNNTQNNTFNLDTFLNVTCKDAMNIDDFFETIDITYDDLVYLSENGLLPSIKKDILSQLIKMDQTKRPIHCTDAKRKKFHMKKKDKWISDINNDQLINEFKLKSSIYFIAKKKFMPYPPDGYSDDELADMSTKINRNSSLLSLDKTKKKTARLLLSALTELTIDKTLL